MSTYSTTLRIELIGAGQQDGTWGTTTNNNLGTVIEQAITGVQTVTMANTDYTLTAYNGLVDEARNAVLIIAGDNATANSVIAPSVEKLYVITNSLNSSGVAYIKTSGNTATSIPNGKTMFMYCDGTNFYPVNLVASANTLSTARTIAISGGATGTATSFDGSTNVTIPVTDLNATNLTSGTVPAARLSGAYTITASTAVAANSVTTTNFSIIEEAGVVKFKYGSTTLMTIDSGGNVAAIGNVTAYYGS